MYKPTLTIMVGLDGIYRDSAVLKLAAEYPYPIILNFDLFKYNMYNGVIKDEYKVIEKILKSAKKYLENKKDVIINVPALKSSVRRGIIQFFKNIDCRIVAYIVNIPFDKCLLLNRHSKNSIPDYRLDCQLRQFEIPFYEEGFDEILFDKFDEYDEIKVEDFIKLYSMMDGFDQKNSNHHLNLLEHCTKASKIFYCLYSNEWWYNSNYVIALMLHDIGKLFTQSYGEDGECHYYSHHNVGAYYLLDKWSSITNNKDKFLEILFCVNYHMKPFDFDNPRVKKKYEKIFGKYKLEGLIKMNNCDRLAKT